MVAGLGAISQKIKGALKVAQGIQEKARISASPWWRRRSATSAWRPQPILSFVKNPRSGNKKDKKYSTNDNGNKFYL